VDDETVTVVPSDIVVVAVPETVVVVVEVAADTYA